MYICLVLLPVDHLQRMMLAEHGWASFIRPADPRFESALCDLPQRYSIHTFPQCGWRNRSACLAHNGADQHLRATSLDEVATKSVWPQALCDLGRRYKTDRAAGSSDSASADSVFEGALFRAGRSAPMGRKPCWYRNRGPKQAVENCPKKAGATCYSYCNSVDGSRWERACWLLAMTDGRWSAPGWTATDCARCVNVVTGGWFCLSQFRKAGMVPDQGS